MLRFTFLLILTFCSSPLLAFSCGPLERAPDKETELKYSSVKVLNLLENTQDCFKENDGTQVFLRVYQLITENMILWKGTKSTDPQTLEKLISAFAYYYRFALHHYYFGDRSLVPRAWRVSFEYAFDKEFSPKGHALLGMMAHISHDLPLALTDVLSTREFVSYRSDYFEINQLFENSISRMADIVESFPSEGLGDAKTKISGAELKVLLKMIKTLRRNSYFSASLLEMTGNHLAPRRAIERFTGKTSAKIARALEGNDRLDEIIEKLWPLLNKKWPRGTLL